MLAEMNALGLSPSFNVGLNRGFSGIWMEGGTMGSKVLVTGGYGCIGAETVKWLLENTPLEIVIASRTVSAERTARAFYGLDHDRLQAVSLDISKAEQVNELFSAHDFSHVIHLAAFQTPDCNAHRDRGLQINLAGTQHLIEAIKQSSKSIERFVFASSIAVYGPRSQYPPGVVSSESEPSPGAPYGIWKLAGEQLSRVFHQETGVPTICLRPAVLYGPGRDLGLTSSPTTAMKHVVLGTPYKIPFCSRQDFQFAPDVGATTGMIATESFDGFGVYTLPSHCLSIERMVEKMRDVAEHIQGIEPPQISVGDEEVPFICDLESQKILDRFPSIPQTSIDDGIRRTLETFCLQHKLGWL